MVVAAVPRETAGGIKVEFHADDYGMFPAQSRRILSCYQDGRLNGVSVMPNGHDLAECMKALQPELQNIAVTVHLNLIEGKSLCAANEVSLLTDKNGNLNSSFGKLLLQSFLPGRKKYYQELKKELRAQILSVRKYLPPEMPLRLDGHAHYHMLPVVFDALMDVVREEGFHVSYIRIPREYLSLYLRNLGKLKDFAPINLVKVLILNLLALRNQCKYGAYLDKLEKKLFLGVFLSGRMHHENVSAVLPDALALAKKLGCGMELLAHPGSVCEPEDIARITNPDDLVFLTSPMRDAEATMYKTE